MPPKAECDRLGTHVEETIKKILVTDDKMQTRDRYLEGLKAQGFWYCLSNVWDKQQYLAKSKVLTLSLLAHAAVVEFPVAAPKPHHLIAIAVRTRKSHIKV